MTAVLLTIKLHIPAVRPELVPRPGLIGRLNAGLHRRLTPVSASTGFGKTTLLSEWVSGCGRPVAWLSLDEGDNDPTRFLAYLVAALQTIRSSVGQGLSAALQSPGPVNVERHRVMSSKLDPETNPGQPMVYQIRIKGHLGPQWTDWFEGLTITLEANGETLLAGPVVDEAALHGLLRRVRDLGMPLLSVNRVDHGPADASDTKP